MSDRWEDALRRLERDLDAVEEAMANGEVPALPAWEPPTDLGPLPDALAAWAERILTRAGEVRSLGVAALHEMAEEQRRLATRREAGNTYAGVHGS